MRNFLVFLIAGIAGVHWFIQRKWGRKLMGGKFYYMQTALPMAPFWSEVKFKSCQAVCLKEEEYKP